MISAVFIAGLSFVFLVGFWLGGVSKRVVDAEGRQKGKPRDSIMNERALWCYRQLLFREPQEAELSEWCVPVRSIEVMAKLFVMSPEFSRLPPGRKRQARAALERIFPPTRNAPNDLAQRPAYFARA